MINPISKIIISSATSEIPVIALLSILRSANNQTFSVNFY